MCLLLFFEKALAGKEELQKVRQKVYLLVRIVQLPVHYLKRFFYCPKKASKFKGGKQNDNECTYSRCRGKAWKKDGG